MHLLRPPQHFLAEKLFNDVEEVTTCLNHCFAEKLFFFIISVYTYINSVRKILCNPICFTSSTPVIPISKYLGIRLADGLSHAKWANLIT